MADDADKSKPSIEVTPETDKVWGWDTESWDLPERLAVDLGLDPEQTPKAMLAREWGWAGWS